MANEKYHPQMSEADKLLYDLHAQEQKLKDKQEKAEAQYFEQGYQAGWRDDLGVDSKPRFRKQNNEAAWLRGFNKARQEREKIELSKTEPDKEGLNRIKALANEILKK